MTWFGWVLVTLLGVMLLDALRNGGRRDAVEAVLFLLAIIGVLTIGTGHL